MLVHAKRLQAMPLNETANFQHLIIQLSLHIGKGHHRGLIACRFEYPAEQAETVINFRIMASDDFREHFIRKISVRAREIENEIYGSAHFTNSLFLPVFFPGT